VKHYNYAGAAELLGLDSPTWLQKHIRELPHRRFGRYVRFTEADLAEISAMHAVRPFGEACPSTAQQIPQALLDLKPGRAPGARRRTHPIGLAAGGTA